MLFGLLVLAEIELGHPDRQQGVQVIGGDLQNLIELFDRVLIEGSIEVELSQLLARGRVRRIGIDLCLELVDSCLVDLSEGAHPARHSGRGPLR